MFKSNLNMKKKMKIELILFCIGFCVILIKLGYVQFVMGKEYSRQAIEQLNTSRKIPANRGIIYDCNGEILANSSTVYTVNINPVKIAPENKERVAKALTDIFGLEYDDVLKKVTKNVSVVNIAKKQPKEVTDILESSSRYHSATQVINKVFTVPLDKHKNGII